MVLTVEGNCVVANVGTSVNMTAAGTVIVKKDLYCAGTYTNFTASLTVSGDVAIGGDLTTTTGNIVVGGDCRLGGFSSTGAGDLTVKKDCFVTLSLEPGVAGSIVNIAGNLWCGTNLNVTGAAVQVGGDCNIANQIVWNSGNTLYIRGTVILAQP